MNNPEPRRPKITISMPEGVRESLRQASEAVSTAALSDSSRASLAAATAGLTRFSTPELGAALESIRASQAKQSAVYETIRRQLSASQADTAPMFAAAHREVTRGLWGLSELASQRSIIEFAMEAQRAAQRVSDQVAGIAQWALQIYPSNWPTERPLLNKGISIAIDDGIVMAWVPSGQPLLRLFSATDRAARMEVLRHYRRKIVSDCEVALDATTMEYDDPHVLALLEAIDVFKRRYVMAAQALAANVIDSWSRELHPSEGNPRKGGKSTAKVVADKAQRWQDSDLGVPAILVYGALHHALGNFWPGTSAEPVGFNRNVTSHLLRSDQYRTGHAVQSIMTATALLIATHEGHVTSTNSHRKSA